MRTVTIHEDLVEETPAGLSVQLTRHFDGKNYNIIIYTIVCDRRA